MTAAILLVEDEPDLGLYEASVLEAHGHQVIRCSGGITPFTGCPMLKGQACPLAEEADLILFSCRLFAPLRHHTYSGRALLNAYRSHMQYGRLPMLVVSVGTVDRLKGTGSIRFIQKFSEPNAVIHAVGRLLLDAGIASRSKPHATALKR